MTQKKKYLLILLVLFISALMSSHIYAGSPPNDGGNYSKAQYLTNRVVDCNSPDKIWCKVSPQE